MLLLTSNGAVAYPESYVATSSAWLLTTAIVQVNGGVIVLRPLVNKILRFPTNVMVG